MDAFYYIKNTPFKHSHTHLQEVVMEAATVSTSFFNTIVGYGRTAINKVTAASTMAKLVMVLGLVNIAGSKKAYDRAIRRTPGKGLLHTAKIIAKTMGGTAYWLSGLFTDEWSRRARQTKATKRSFTNKQRTALNNDLAKVPGGDSLTSLKRQYKAGLVILKRHHAPARYAEEMGRQFKLAIAKATAVKAASSKTASSNLASSNLGNALFDPKTEIRKMHRKAKSPVAKVSEVSPVV